MNVESASFWPKGSRGCEECIFSVRTLWARKDPIVGTDLAYKLGEALGDVHITHPVSADHLHPRVRPSYHRPAQTPPKDPDWPTHEGPKQQRKVQGVTPAALPSGSRFLGSTRGTLATR